MSAADAGGRKPAGNQRVGYAIAAAIHVVLLYLVNVRPGWEALPFLTAGTASLLTLFNLSLVAGLVVNVVQLFHDPPWLVAAGAVVTTGIGLAVLIRIWQVFPFDFGSAPAWGTVTRVLLVVAVLGTTAGLLVHLVTLTGTLFRGGRTRSRHV
ncbi:hypothetical protein [Paractinoplanes rishiriensis]|uniref:Uncharacterized protein n=1 Tax=Paractinoplanes rishiriensis TaxID=1050105 RepID=A0A919K9U4_9ACTN|nr:hypothetical protein [Actinoplanes rishiriensis]GIF02093.1 hypothetical protein Ari01nite_95570 [Actinoplanes rishiriensis]